MQVEDMLKNSRDLVSNRQERRGRKRVYAPHIKWAKWLTSGGEEKEGMPAEGRKDNRRGASKHQHDEEDEAKSLNSSTALIQTVQDPEQSSTTATESQQKPKKKRQPRRMQDKTPDKVESKKLTASRAMRGRIADILEGLQDSEDVLYAVKLTIATFLVVWPAFVAPWNTWFSLNRGLWAALQLILVTEVSIGTSVWTFFLRAIGTTLGCLWGWAAVGSRGKYISMTIMLIAVRCL